MKDNRVVLLVMSLLSIVFVSIHVADDVARGYDKWSFEKLSFLAILVVWLYGTLVLHERRSGRIIMILGGLLAGIMPVAHMRGTGAFVKSSGAFFFVWTLFAVGASGIFSAILAAQALRRGKIMTVAAHENPDRRG